MKDSTHLPKAIAKRYGVGLPKVLDWIKRNELGAVNVASDPSGRPRWRVRDCDLLAFEMKRMNRPQPPITSRVRRTPAGEVPRVF